MIATLVDIPVCLVPTGEYTVGSQFVPQSRPEHHLELPGFMIARAAVTNEQFAGFIESDGYSDPTLWTETGWRWQHSARHQQPYFWKDRAHNRPLQPVVGVSWHEAVAFAYWLSRETGQPWRLATEVEWEAAARGTEPDALPDAQVCNTAEHGLGHALSADFVGHISWCGAYNLCGNVWEWCSSRWGHNWQSLEYTYPYQADDGREALEGGSARVMRGGSWFNALVEARPAYRSRYLPGSRGSNIGFRLVRSRDEGTQH